MVGSMQSETAHVLASRWEMRTNTNGFQRFKGREHFKAEDSQTRSDAVI